MNIRFALPFLSGALLLAGASAPLAQQTTPGASVSTYTEVENDATMVPGFNMTVGQIEDLDIYAANGDEVGEVEEVLANSTGQVAAVAAEVGGFLGIGAKEVIIGLDQIQLQGDRLLTSLTRDQLEQLPAWDD